MFDEIARLRLTRNAARALMLHGKAEGGEFVVPERFAIMLLHTLPEIEQIPDKETWTWTTAAT